jgi:hypothetical protein
MTFRKSILLLIALVTIAGLVGCSSSSKPLTVTLSSVPTSLTVNSQTAVTATVANDKANGGVTWSCTPVGACGTFSAATSASGVAVTYTAPAVITTGVSIIATSVTNTSVSASATGITIAAATLADGTYVFSLTGQDDNGSSGYSGNSSPYSVAGAFTISGGAVTGGEQDYVDASVAGTTDLINPTGSAVTTTADGNLQITLVTCLGTGANACASTDSSLPSGGTETLAGTITPLNPNKALITEFDTTATSSGELNLQAATPAATLPAGGYAFALNGLDPSDIGYISLGGIIVVDNLGGTTGTISGAGSEFDVNDADGPYDLTQSEPVSSGTVAGPASAPAAPDAFGRVTFTLNTPDFGQLVIAGYIVDSTKIRLVENFTDDLDSTAGGTAFSQPAAITAAAVTGNTYVVGLNGLDEQYYDQVAGQFTLNADNSVSGFINYNDNTGTAAQPPSAITGGTWSVDAAGTVSLTGVTDGTADYALQFYVDGNGHVLAITLDDGDVLGGRGAQQSGSNFTASNFSGAYSFGTTGWDYNNVDEFDAVGPVTADGVGIVAGFTDYNWFGSGVTFPNSPMSGAFTSASSGVFTGTITGLDADTCTIFGMGGGCNTDAFSYYLIDATGENIAIETDPSQLTLGEFIQQ